MLLHPCGSMIATCYVLLLISITLKFVDAQNEQQGETIMACSICGEGRKVGNPNAVFSFTGQPVAACGVLETAGAQGFISPSQCSSLAEIIFDLCDCQPNDVVLPRTNSPTPAIVLPQTRTNPTSISPLKDEPVCEVCGPGLKVGSPDATFAFPGQPSTLCGDLEAAGQEGLIPADACDLVPALIAGACKCQVEQAATPPGCSVCGVGFKVGNPNAAFSFPGQPFVSCATLEIAGKEGLVSRGGCPFLPDLISDQCDCQPIDALMPTTNSPSPWTQNSAVKPTDDEPTCEICGVGREVGDPNAIFVFPGQPIVRCGVMESVGRVGMISLEQCSLLPGLISSICSCQPHGSSSSTNTPSQSPASVAPSKAPQPISLPTAIVPGTFPVCQLCEQGGFLIDQNSTLPFEFVKDESLCSDLERHAAFGLIDEGLCITIRNSIHSFCGGCTVPSSPLTILTSTPTSTPTTLITQEGKGTVNASANEREENTDGSSGYVIYLVIAVVIFSLSVLIFFLCRFYGRKSIHRQYGLERACCWQYYECNSWIHGIRDGARQKANQAR